MVVSQNPLNLPVVVDPVIQTTNKLPDFAFPFFWSAHGSAECLRMNDFILFFVLFDVKLLLINLAPSYLPR